VHEWRVQALWGENTVPSHVSRSADERVTPSLAAAGEAVLVWAHSLCVRDAQSAYARIV
jgi:hypothetical protein